MNGSSYWLKWHIKKYSFKDFFKPGKSEHFLIIWLFTTSAYRFEPSATIYGVTLNSCSFRAAILLYRFPIVQCGFFCPVLTYSCPVCPYTTD